MYLFKLENCDIMIRKDVIKGKTDRNRNENKVLRSKNKNFGAKLFCKTLYIYVTFFKATE